MPQRIRIRTESVTIEGELNDGPTAKAIAAALPIEGDANRWGEEIYFVIPVRAELEPDARADVEVGELAYWPSGDALCIFFGPTPASSGPQPRAASAVNILGRVDGDATVLTQVRQGEKVVVEAV